MSCPFTREQLVTIARERLDGHSITRPVFESEIVRRFVKIRYCDVDGSLLFAPHVTVGHDGSVEKNSLLALTAPWGDPSPTRCYFAAALDVAASVYCGGRTWGYRDGLFGPSS